MVKYFLYRKGGHFTIAIDGITYHISFDSADLLLKSKMAECVDKNSIRIKRERCTTIYRDGSEIVFGGNTLLRLPLVGVIHNDTYVAIERPHSGVMIRCSRCCLNTYENNISDKRNGVFCNECSVIVDKADLRTSDVYLMWAEGSSFFKIGITTNILSRINALKTACPFPIILVAMFCGKHTDERNTHKEFNPYRTKGEWFNFPNTIVPFVFEYFKHRHAKFVINADDLAILLDCDGYSTAGTSAGLVM